MQSHSIRLGASTQSGSTGTILLIRLPVVIVGLLFFSGEDVCRNQDVVFKDSCIANDTKSKFHLFNKLRDFFFIRSGFVRSCFRDSGRMSTDSANADGLICSSEFLDAQR